MNFKKFVYSEGKIDARTKATVALAVASATRCGVWIDLLSERCRQLELPQQHTADTLAVAATCAMYNAFFKFRDISGSDLFFGMGVGLRAHTFTNTSLDERTVELVNIAISDLNGCKPCTSGHVESARKLGVSDDAILETVQCAATMAAGCQFLNAAQ
jgi:alkyl hydroperoxide reductase subunit D